MSTFLLYITIVGVKKMKNITCFFFFFLSFLIQVQENIQPYNVYSTEMRKHERKKNSVVSGQCCIFVSFVV